MGWNNKTYVQKMLSSLLNKGPTIIVLQIATNIRKILQMKIEKKEEEEK